MINLTVVIDNDEAIKKLRELQNVATTTTSSVVSDSERMDASMQKFRNTLAQVAAGFGMAQFAKQVVTVRGEFQSLEIAMETMLGSKEKANRLMAEVTELAAKTPFDLQQVAAAAKQLLAFGSTAESVSDEIVMLGDIASGLSIPLGDLIYLYGTTRAQGKLFTQDLRQFMGRGIPLAKELATQFGVAEQEVGDLVTAGRVGFDDLKIALENLTAEGSMFGGGMERQSQGIEGRIAALQDSIQIMFNEIGKSAEDIITGSIDAISWVTEHWRELLSVLKYVIAAYGSYKAAVMLVAAWHRAMNIYQMAKAFFETTKALRRTTQAMIAFNTVVKASPIGILASVLGVVGASFIDLGSSAKDAASGIDDVEEASDKAERTIGRLEQAAIDLKDRINELFSQILDPNTSTEQRMMLLAKLTELYPELADVVDLEAISTEKLKEVQDEYNKSLEKELTILAARDDAMTRKSQLDKAKTDKGLARAQLESAQNVYSSVSFNKKAMFRGSGISTYYGDEYTYNEGTYNRLQLGAIFTNKANQLAAQYFRELFDKLNRGLIDENEFNSSLAEIQQRVDDELLKEVSKITHSTHTSHMGNTASPGTRTLDESDFDVNSITFRTGENVNLVKTYLESVEAVKKAENDYETSIKTLETIDPNFDIELATLDDVINQSESYKKSLEELRFELDIAKQGLDDAIKGDDAGKVSYWREKVDNAQKAYDELAKPYEDYLKKQEKLAETERKRIEKAESVNRKVMDEAAQARIDVMEDGFEKEMAQLDFDFDQYIRKIEEQQKELKELQGGSITKEQEDAFEAMRKKAINEYVDKASIITFGDAKDYEEQLKVAEASWDEYLAEYGTFQERYAAIKRQYERKLKDATTDGERAAIRRERDIVFAEYEVEAQGFARNLADRTLSEIETITRQLQDEVEAKQAAYDALDKSDTAQAQNLLAEIDILNAKIKALEKLTNEASDSLAKDNWAGATEVFQNISQMASDAADSISEYDEMLSLTFKSMAKIASLGTNLAGALEGVKTAFKQAGEAASTMEMASAILAVVSVAIQAISFISNIFTQNKEAAENAARAIDKYNDALAKLSLQEVRDAHISVFGKDKYGEYITLIEKAKEYKQALDDIRDSANDAVNFKDISKSDFFTRIEAGDIFDNNTLIADMRSGWQKFWGTGDDNIITTSLEDFYEDGVLNLEKLKAYYDTYKDYLSSEQLELVEQLISNGELYEESINGLTDYLTDIFGDLGYTMTEALVDSFESGTDAAIAFGEATSDMIEKLATDMIHAALVQPIIDEYADKIEALNRQDMSPEERVAELTKLIGDMSQEVLGTQDMVNDVAQKVRDEAKSAGIDGVFDDDVEGQNATSKGFETMSQETGSELNGRFTDIQGQTHRIAEAVEFCKSLQSSQLAQTQSINSTVAMIHNDTSLIASHTKSLAQMSKDLNDIKMSIYNGAL